MSRANAFIILPEDLKVYEDGDMVEVVPIEY